MESATQSILSRRPAAGGLPHFHLPHPNTSLDSQIPRVSDSISPPSSSLNSSNSHSSHTGIAQYNSQNGWSVPNTSSYTYGSITSGVQPSAMSSNYSRHLYSPSAPGGAGGPGQPSYGARSSQPPATADGLAPPYDNVNHPYPMSMTGAATSHSSFATQPPHSQHLQHGILSPHTTQPPSPALTTSADSYSRAPPTASYYAASSSTPQQPPFPAFPPPHPSPSQLSSTTAAGGPTRASPSLSSQHHASMGTLPPYGNRHYGYSTAVPNMGPMVLSNMGNPGGQMHLMGTTNPLSHYHHAGHGLPHHSMYAGPPNGQQDRPFTCETCSKSFNRNHDLKRHKRIHLAIKPFPCVYCDKAFSRTDALRRHRLVKGCGNNGKTSPERSGNGGSPEDDEKIDPDAPSGSSGGMKPEPT
ncbi:hypothetical protein F5B17DRAFT_440427 [Nemania serpens]|nr:hypothetical protein F5B17DRAFT_440427 [Nemania serpens]